MQTHEGFMWQRKYELQSCFDQNVNSMVRPASSWKIFLNKTKSTYRSNKQARKLDLVLMVYENVHKINIKKLGSS